MGKNIKIEQLDFQMKNLKIFHQFEIDLYKNDPLYIPSSESKFLSYFSEKNPYFKYGKVALFIATQDEKIVGRIASFRNPLLDTCLEKFGCLGYYECFEDQEIASQLFKAGESWLQEQGATFSCGPMNFGIWCQYRLRLENLQRPSFLGEPYHKPWYYSQFAEAGYTIERLWYSDEVSLPQKKQLFEERLEKLKKRIPRCEEMGYSLEKAQKIDSHFWEDSHRLLQEGFAHHLYYYPINLEEMKYWYSDLEYIVRPKDIYIAKKEGKTVGMLMSCGNHIHAIKSMQGKSHLLSKIKFLFKRDYSEKIGLYTILEKNSIENKSGMASWLVYAFFKDAYENHDQKIIAPLMYEGNRSASFLAIMGERIEKYALLRKNFNTVKE